MSFFEPSDFYEVYGADVREGIAAKTNKLLAERGKVVYQYSGINQGDWSAIMDDDFEYRAKGILVCIEEIENDSAEKVLRDFLKWDLGYISQWKDLDALKERAKKVLSRE